MKEVATMGRLIDLGVAHEHVQRLLDKYSCFSREDVYTMAGIVEADYTLETIPTVDADPVVHGHWNVGVESHQDFVTGEVDEQFYLECSKCRRRVWGISQDALISGRDDTVVSNFPYCHCGAKMDVDNPDAQ
jgi:hypothetical protein